MQILLIKFENDSFTTKKFKHESELKEEVDICIKNNYLVTGSIFDPGNWIVYLLRK
jgi:hypothetical protein